MLRLLLSDLVSLSRGGVLCSVSVFLAVFPVISTVVARPAARLQPDYDEWFTSEALRVEYFHFGNSTSESFAIDRVVVEPAWPGSRRNLTNAPDLGKYRFKVLDAQTKKPLFEQGYCTLFGEWQTTGEASKVTRVFSESLRFPRPRKPVLVQIHSRNRKGVLEKVFEQRIDPSSHTVEQWVEKREVEVLVLHDSGDPSTTLDIVIIAEGYEQGQAEKARRDLKRFSGIFLATPPFDRHASRISIRGVIPLSDRTGPSEPRKGIFTSSAVGTTFNTFDSARYLTTFNNRTMRDLAAHAAYDAIFVMVNSSRYGGGGIYNFFSIFVSDNEYDEYIFIHEFGHGFAGLADEYYTSSVAYSEFYPPGVEPWEPNITALLHGPGGLKWRDLVTPGTPIPTPALDCYKGSIGAFEGAGYAAKGLFRPALDCKMFSRTHTDFCAVCMRAIEQAIELYTE